MLLLTHNIYYGAKVIPLFSQRPFHFRVCLNVLWRPISCVDTNTIPVFVEISDFLFQLAGWLDRAGSEHQN